MFKYLIQLIAAAAAYSAEMKDFISEDKCERILITGELRIDNANSKPKKIQLQINEKQEIRVLLRWLSGLDVKDTGLVLDGTDLPALVDEFVKLELVLIGGVKRKFIITDTDVLVDNRWLLVTPDGINKEKLMELIRSHIEKNRNI